MSAIGQTLCVIGLTITIVQLITYDPPSGYNMGTGDSMVPIITSLVLVVIGGCMWAF